MQFLLKFEIDVDVLHIDVHSVCSSQKGQSNLSCEDREMVCAAVDPRVAERFAILLESSRVPDLPLDANCAKSLTAPSELCRA